MKLAHCKQWVAVWPQNIPTSDMYTAGDMYLASYIRLYSHETFSLSVSRVQTRGHARTSQHATPASDDAPALPGPSDSEPQVHATVRKDLGT